MRSTKVKLAFLKLLVFDVFALIAVGRRQPGSHSSKKWRSTSYSIPICIRSTKAIPEQKRFELILACSDKLESPEMFLPLWRLSLAVMATRQAPFHSPPLTDNLGQAIGSISDRISVQITTSPGVAGLVWNSISLTKMTHVECCWNAKTCFWNAKTLFWNALRGKSGFLGQNNDSASTSQVGWLSTTDAAND